MLTDYLENLYFKLNAKEEIQKSNREWTLSPTYRTDV